MENWGTLSTHDHRSNLLKRSLVVFDRLVIPVPSKPIYDLTNQDLDELGAAVEFLKDHDAAIDYPWNPDEFIDWKEDAIREGLSVGLGDSLYDSRVMLVDSVEKIANRQGVEARGIPVYGSMAEHEEKQKDISKIQESLLVAISQEIFLPDEGCSLEEIVDLRSKKEFKAALKSCQDWQWEVLPQLLLEESPKRISEAVSDFKEMSRKYTKFMENQKIDRRLSFVIATLAIGGAISTAASANFLGLVATAGAAFFQLEKLKTPAWKIAQDTKYSPAGIVFESKSHFGKN